MFAIAANGFLKPSETFIRSHVRRIAPGQTLLIAERRDLKTPVPAPLIMFSKRFPVYVPEGQSLGAVLRSALDPRRFGRSRSAYLSMLLRAAGVRTLMAEYGTSAVHVMDAAKAANCRFFVHFHGVDASSKLREPDMLRRYQQLFDIADGVIAPSAFLAKNLAEVGCPEEKLHVVPCGVDVSAFNVGAPDPTRFLSVGRFTDKKAPLTTIRAFAAVHARHQNAVLEMMGDGPLMAEAKGLIAELGIGRAVVLHGMTGPDQVRSAMARCGVFIQHSVTAQNGDVEGLPVAILEAMASGLPVVATRHSGIPEAVLHEQTGLLVDEHDVDGMTQAMARLMTTPQIARTYGAAGRARVVSEFSEEITIGKLQAIMGLPPT